MLMSDRKSQISYAPKALDRSLAAYLRCDLKANVFCLLLRLPRVLVKQITHIRSLFGDNLSAAHILSDSVNNVLPPQLTMSPENHHVNQIFADIRWFPRFVFFPFSSFFYSFLLSKYIFFLSFMFSFLYSLFILSISSSSNAWSNPFSRKRCYVSDQTK